MPTFPEIRSEFFFEHREGGIVNVGGHGTVSVDGTAYELGTVPACTSAGARVDVVFASTGAGRTRPFYLVCAPAHTTYPTTLVEAGGGTSVSSVTS